MNRITAIHCFYQGQGINKLIIESTEPLDEYSIYEYDFVKKEKLDYIISSNKREILFENELKTNKRNFFILEINDDYIVFGHRIVPLQGMYNVRDIGGYLTEDGKRIKWNTILRGDHLINLKIEEKEKFESMYIDTIIDLRSAGEIDSHPNPYLMQKQTIYCDPNAHTAAFAGILQDLNSKDNDLELSDLEFNSKDAIKQMELQQKRFVHEKDSKDAFSRVLRALLSDETENSYQHCRGGKDRTGYSIMLVQGILGLDREQIVEDYMLTKLARQEKNKSYKERFLKMANGNQDIADYLYVHFDTQENFILAAYDDIINAYGSIQKYVIKELGIELEMISKFKDKYLE